jgi:hypothetical protein
MECGRGAVRQGQSEEAQEADGAFSQGHTYNLLAQLQNKRMKLDFSASRQHATGQESHSMIVRRPSPPRRLSASQPSPTLPTCRILRSKAPESSSTVALKSQRHQHSEWKRQAPLSALTGRGERRKRRDEKGNERISSIAKSRESVKEPSLRHCGRKIFTTAADTAEATRPC